MCVGDGDGVGWGGPCFASFNETNLPSVIQCFGDVFGCALLNQPIGVGGSERHDEETTAWMHARCARLEGSKREVQ